MGLAAISYSRCQTATLGRVGKIACRTLNTTLRPCAIMPTRPRCHESGTRGGPDAWAKARLTLCRVERPRARLCPPYRSRFSLLTSTSPFSSSFLISLPLREGRAERRWRLDACEGTRISPAITRSRKTRVNALVTGGQTPHRTNRPEQMPALRSLRTTGSPWPRSICAIRTSQPSLRRGVLRSPATGTLAFTALHVGFLARARARRCPAFAKASAGKPARAQSSGIGTARLGPLAKASRGSLGSPSGIVRLSSHGSSLPGGAGLAGLPGTVASRIRRRHGLAPPCKDAPRRRPSGTRMTLCSMSPVRGQ
jgi:hypothetical protein